MRRPVRGARRHGHRWAVPIVEKAQGRAYPAVRTGTSSANVRQDLEMGRHVPHEGNEPGHRSGKHPRRT